MQHEPRVPQWLVHYPVTDGGRMVWIHLWRSSEPSGQGPEIPHGERITRPTTLTEICGMHSRPTEGPVPEHVVRGWVDDAVDSLIIRRLPSLIPNQCRYAVRLTPPDGVPCWHNSSEKLNAYRPDWRFNPPQPPTDHSAYYGRGDR